MTLEEFTQKHPNLVFIKSKIKITNNNQLINDNFIIEKDTPAISEKTFLIPLCLTSFPNVLNQMTAMEAGVLAINKCIFEKWEITRNNIECCLSNFNMEF